MDMVPGMASPRFGPAQVQALHHDVPSLAIGYKWFYRRIAEDFWGGMNDSDAAGGSPRIIHRCCGNFHAHNLAERSASWTRAVRCSNYGVHECSWRVRNRSDQP